MEYKLKTEMKERVSALTNREKAQKTYEILQQRKVERRYKADGDFLAYTAANVDRTYKRIYQSRKRRGQP
ncbi:MAG: hypothetical protein AB2417_02735 [Clostridiaceae bacterium]